MLNKKQKNYLSDIKNYDFLIAGSNKRTGFGSTVDSTPFLLKKGKKIHNFYTEDSGLYITPAQQELMERGERINPNKGKWDGVSSRIVKEYLTYQPNPTKILIKSFNERCEKIKENASEGKRGLLDSFSAVRLWNLSIVGAILFGMFSMTMIYRYLGQGVSAGTYIEPKMTTQTKIMDSDDVSFYTQKAIESLNSTKEEELKKEIRKMVKGYPIEEMIDYIAEKDRTVAAFLIGIAKKESNWGKRIPVLNGQDCYNYWGYRGKRKLMGTGGHTCFNSRKDAVDTVSKRLQWLIENQQRNTPAEMVIWKCGSNCAVTGGQAAADKWIRDVDMYFKELDK